MEKTSEVKVFKTDMICKTCNSGELVFNGTIFSAGHMKKYEHVCNNCYLYSDEERQYPIIEYKNT